MMFGQPMLPFPDLDETKKSWRRASVSQKVFRVGLVGGALGGAIYLLVWGKKEREASGAVPIPPTPASAHSNQRGTYR